MEGDITKLLLAVVIGSGVLLGFAYFMSDMGALYGFDSNSSALQSISRVEEVSTAITDAENTTTMAGIEISESLASPYTGAWTALLNIINLPNIFAGMITDMLAVAGISASAAWFYGILILVIIIIVVFAVIKSFIGRDV